MRILLVLLLAMLPAAPALAQSAFPPDADILAMLKARVDEGRAAGIVVGVMDADGSTRILAYGDPGPDAQPLSASSVFEIGSITKTFTATVLADMDRKGEIRLDAPAQDYAPAGLALPARNGRQITLRNLAEQNSGLPRMPGNFRPANPANPYADYGPTQLGDFLSHYVLTRDPGEKFEYSNLGVGLLGYLLSARAGVTYEQLVTERILKPLGMSMTGVALSAQMKTALAKGHDPQGAIAANWDLGALAGAGALRSNMTDMLKYLDANVGPPKNDLERAMRFAQQPSSKATGPKIGLNWITQTTKSGYDIVWHNGGTGGYGAYIGFDQKRGVGVVLLANTAGAPEDIAIHLLDPAMPLAPPPPPPVTHTEIKLPAATMMKYTGVYALDETPAFKLAVTVENGQMIVEPTGQSKIEAFAESETNFFLKAVDAQIAFSAAADGKPAFLTLHQNGLDHRATRLP